MCWLVVCGPPRTKAPGNWKPGQRGPGPIPRGGGQRGGRRFRTCHSKIFALLVSKPNSIAFPLKLFLSLMKDISVLISKVV